MPAVALAIYHCARPEKKKMVFGIMLSAAITSFVCGVTEPIEFCFIFLSPVLFLIHAVLTGLGFAILTLLNVHCGLSFSGGFIDFALINLIPGGRTNWWVIIVVGLIMGTIYYFLFKFFIIKFNVPVIGRELDDDIEADRITVAGDDMLIAVIDAFGGLANIVEANACMSRLRIDVKDTNIIRSDQLKKLGAAGVHIVGHNVQAVFGLKAEQLKEDMRAVMRGEVVKGNNYSENQQSTAVIPIEEYSKITAPFAGKLMKLTDVPDQVFNQKMAGDGFAIELTGADIVAPFDCEVISIFPTKHAIALRSDIGIEVMLHIGIDTVKLDGEGFSVNVAAGQHVKAGQKLMEVDLKMIQDKGFSLISLVLLTGLLTSEYSVELTRRGNVKLGDCNLIRVKKN